MGWLTLDDQAAPSKHALELRMSLNSHTLQLCTMHHQKSIKQSDKHIHTQRRVTLLKARGKTTVAMVDNSHAQGISVSVHFCSTETKTRKTETNHDSNRNIKHYIHIIHVYLFVSRRKLSINMFSFAALSGKAAVCRSGSSTAKREWL
jgi:hypothetical protein